MATITSGDLHTLVREVLEAAGADRRNADRVAEALVSSNLHGVDSHGVYHVAEYVEGIQKGDIAPTALPEILNGTTTTALITGNWTFGHVVAKYGMELAIQKARAQGMAVVCLVRLGHIGRLGEYSEIAASQDMIGMVFASGFRKELPVCRQPFTNNFASPSVASVAATFRTMTLPSAPPKRRRNTLSWISWHASGLGSTRTAIQPSWFRLND